jgi:SAM-dependent methyltransferase
MKCGVCGGEKFTSRPVLWKQLVEDWQLTAAESDYIDRQQGRTCDCCGANLRSIALANALRFFMGKEECLWAIAATGIGSDLSILEINEAGTLTPVLRKIGRHVLGSYPEVDMHALPYPDGTFDFVIHSDTLEHVKNPVHALAECRRVLKLTGALCFTVPTIVGRLSRNRDGLPRSYHGNIQTVADDFVVQTEFGADVWAYIFEAGFTVATIHAVEYPAGLAFLARTGLT